MTVIDDKMQEAKIQRLEAALNAANLEGLSWKARAQQNYAEWEEANKKTERLEAELQKRDQEIKGLIEQRDYLWPYKDKALEARNALTKANKLLEQTIEVLEGFTARGWWAWWRDQGQPLLDNLKALKKEGTE